MALEEEDECVCEGGGEWMATFADLMSLLLTFFVLLLSFANMDVVRFKVVLGSVRDAFGVQFQHPGDIEAVSTSIVQLSQQESSDKIQVIEEIMMLKKVQEFIKEAGMEGLMEASLDERGVVIRIKGHILFGSGEADLLEGAPAALVPIVKLAQTMKHQLSIQGHTDDRPISTSRFPSNWELSTARAVATMRHLIKEGLDPARMNVAGYADMRPVADNDTAEGRAANRRVEFVFMRSGDDKPITKADIEAAQKEIDRLRESDTLIEEFGDAGVGEPRDAGPLPPGVGDLSDAAPLPPDATPPDAAPPDATLQLAPDLRPNFDPTKVTPIGGGETP